uniref:Uncharacterized protein n=1 Tax=Daphnia galeata TaxID=27404 RepID=A0A8J2RXI3_9CRUS|nr:unnamed protein product [Daphnia galeata]
MLSDSLAFHSCAITCQYTFFGHNLIWQRIFYFHPLLNSIKVASQTCIELEVVMMDCMGNRINWSISRLVPSFSIAPLGIASGAMLVGLLAARSKTEKAQGRELQRRQKKYLRVDYIESYIFRINHIRRRKERRDFYSSAFIMSVDEFHLRAVALESAIEEDIANGKIPSL